MRYLRHVLLLSSITGLFLSFPSFGQEAATGASRQARLRELIARSLLGNDTAPSQEERSQVTRDDVAILLDLGLDKDLNYSFRRRAFAFLEAMPDERIITPFVTYYRHCLKTPDVACDLADQIRRISARYYRETKDQRILALYVDVLRDPTSPPGFRLGAIRMLGLCGDSYTGDFLKTYVLWNKDYPIQYHKAEAALALAEHDDATVLDDLIALADFLRDREEFPDARVLSAEAAVRGLAHLARTEDRAQNALQSLAEDYCMSNSFYVYRDEHFAAGGDCIVPTLASVGRPDTLRFLENLMTRCPRPQLVKQIIRALGESGDERTQEFLRTYRQYPADVRRALRMLERRLGPK